MENAVHVAMSDPRYPTVLTERMALEAPQVLVATGNLALLGHRKTGLFASQSAPATDTLRVHDAAASLRDSGKTVISGFQSPVEEDCRDILLRGKQPLIYCPARAIERMRIPREWREAFDAGRVLMLSPFQEKPIRKTRQTASICNRFVAALCDECVLAMGNANGMTAEIAKWVETWKIGIISWRK